MGRIFRNIIIVIIWLVLTNSPGGVRYAYADESDIFLSNLKPNVLLILDNSNSMDEDFVANAICSWATGSRSVEGRRQLLSVVNANANNMRIGLMSFKLPASSKQYLHNSPYYVSYNKKSYCPTPPAEPGCVDYCINGTISSKNACNTACQAGNANFDADYTMSDVNGQDKVLTNVVGNSIRTKYCPLIYPKTNSITNPTDGAHYVYYKLPGTDYAGSNQGNGFCYATTYVANGVTDTASDDSYACYHTKTGTNDDLNNYSTNFYNGSFVPTDEDVALGFLDFGKRNFWYYTGQTWFANSSPGNGYLHVPCADNVANSQLNLLTPQLAMHENDQAGYMSCANTANPNACTYIVNAGLTPTAGTFHSAINYFRGDTDYKDGTAYTSPVQAWCQKNFIIFVTDGLPSTNESGTGDTATNLIPTSGVTTTAGTVLYEINQLRSLTVPAIAGYTFDIQTYVLGMALTDQSKASLDLMAQVGGTADPNGHAYYADNPTQLAAALAAIPQDIISRTYSFATSSVASSRISDENFIYVASFVPINSDPFWPGYLKQYNINADGSLGTVNWDAGAQLAATAGSTRNMYTLDGGALIPFVKSGNPHVTHNMTGTTTGERDTIVDYIRGEVTPDNWKLGDIFHSNPVNVGTPIVFYEDSNDQNYGSYTCNGSGGITVWTNAFGQHRCDHQRSTANGLRRVVVGANDGQFHVFSTAGGLEQWSFVPPNLLPQLQYLAHATHPTTLTHQYLVDGPVSVADVWWKSVGGTDDGTTKVRQDWHTLAIFGEGAGGVNLWSSDSNCSSNTNNYQDTSDATYKYYCGYYAFNVTDTSSAPATFMWHLGGTGGISAANGRSYLGQPWSKMMIGRVKYDNGGLKEKWVGFIGGGYNGASCTAGQVCGVDCDCRGKGFYVVDLSNGQILWSYTRNNDVNMQYSMPANPYIVDTDMDGFIDTVYVGDMAGNMWRFKFCKGADTQPSNNCGISGHNVNWTGSRLYSSAAGQPIFGTATFATDDQGNQWVFWGTGNKVTPKDTAGNGALYAVKDDGSTTYTIADLKNISAAGQTYNTGDAQAGYYINLPATGEKIITDPTLFGGVLYFTSYTPPAGGGDLCAQGGSSSIYALLYTSGNGAFGGSARSQSLGGGLATAPLISMKPGGSTIGDIYVTISNPATGTSTQRYNFNPPGLSNRVNILNWRDRRIQ